MVPNNKCQIGLLSCLLLHTFAMVVSTETESVFFTANYVSYSSLTGVDRNLINTVYDAESVVGFLIDVSSLYQLRPIISEWLTLIPPDAWKMLVVLFL